MKKILHRAFIGGIDGRQSTPFLDAMKSFLKNNPDADFEILTCKSVKERKLSPKQFVDFSWTEMLIILQLICIRIYFRYSDGISLTCTTRFSDCFIM